ncbi:MAG: SDR family oxidoreductase [Hyphomicrobiaceae bacterium]|nr:SDR family oxidoreductase [Hyphomicrobiaceae bacterium]
MTGRLKDKVAVVIGSARGIGRAVAEAFGAEGARLALVDWNEDEGRRTAESFNRSNQECIFIKGDVSNRGDLLRAVDDVIGRFGRIDILCQNAGIFPQTLIEDISEDEWDRVLAVNLKGTFLSVQACLPVMRAQGYGRIVLTSSITGPRVGQPRNAHYSATKAGMNGFMRTAALELAPSGITINAVEPGNILTEGITGGGHDEAFFIAQQAAIPMGRLGTPQEVAHAYVFLASDEAAYITGQSIIVDGGQILPEGAVTP